MKPITINLTSNLGMDCSGQSHYLDEYVTINLDDEDVAKLEAICHKLDEPNPDRSMIEDEDENLAEIIDTEAYSALHDLMVIQGWEEFGWQACSRYDDELIEEDIENGEFDFECPEGIDESDEYEYADARQKAWEEKEIDLMSDMDTHEMALYLEGRYGLDTDITGMDYNWSIDVIQ